MGASNYSSTSSNFSRRITSSRIIAKEERRKSAMKEMLELLEEVENCRDDVDQRKIDLELAKKELQFAERELEKAEERVADQLNNLDPDTRNRFRRMIGAMDDRDR